MTLKHPPEPLLTKVWRFLWKLSGRRRALDRLFTGLMHYRRYLPVREPGELIPEVNEAEVRFTRLPLGIWSTPLTDVLVVVKAAIGFRSKRILEIGSYHGYTARALAENTLEETTICTVDIDP